MANEIFVGNLNFNTTEEMLREIFCVVGQIKSCRMMMDKDTGRSKGYAFIEFTALEAVESAIRLLQGTEVNGRALRLNYAAQGQGSAGGGAGGGGGMPHMQGPGGYPMQQHHDMQYQQHQHQHQQHMHQHQMMHHQHQQHHMQQQQQQQQHQQQHTHQQQPPPPQPIVYNPVTNLQLHEAWDILEAMKKLVEEQRAKPILEAHPGLVQALNEIQWKLGLSNH